MYCKRRRDEVRNEWVRMWIENKSKWPIWKKKSWFGPMEWMCLKLQRRIIWSMSNGIVRKGKTGKSMDGYSWWDNKKRSWKIADQRQCIKNYASDGSKIYKNKQIWRQQQWMELM